MGSGELLMRDFWGFMSKNLFRGGKTPNWAGVLEKNILCFLLLQIFLKYFLVREFFNQHFHLVMNKKYFLENFRENILWIQKII
jgi:hypothetical protein